MEFEPFSEDEIKRARVSARDAEIVNRIIAHRAAPERRRDLAAAYNMSVTNLDRIEKRGLRILGNARGFMLPADAKEVPVNKSGLSVRAANCLLSAGIKTLGDLAERNRRDLCAIPNLGVVVANEIELKLASYGMCLTPVPPSPDSNEISRISALTKAVDRNLTEIERIFARVQDMRVSGAIPLDLKKLKRESRRGMMLLRLGLDALAKTHADLVSVSDVGRGDETG